MKYKLIFSRLGYDPVRVWTEIREVVVEIPDDMSDTNNPDTAWRIVGGMEVSNRGEMD